MTDNERQVIDSNINFNNKFDSPDGGVLSEYRTLDATDSDSKDKNISQTSDDVSRVIFRYKFSDLFAEQLFEFSKIHQYDDRVTFKEAWTEWTEENDEVISAEIKRLTDLGYEGNILEKMFKSSRYYFRNKSTEKKTPVPRRPYIGVTQDLLDSIDDHISKTTLTKPAISFVEFCRENVEILQEEVKRLCVKGFKDPIEIRDKIKKTYKNRYFTLINSSS
jgi:hypothetical protein